MAAKSYYHILADLLALLVDRTDGHRQLGLDCSETVSGMPSAIHPVCLSFWQ